MLTVTLKLTKKQARFLAEVMEEKSWLSPGNMDNCRLLAATAAQLFDALGNKTMAASIRQNAGVPEPVCNHSSSSSKT